MKSINLKSITLTAWPHFTMSLACLCAMGAAGALPAAAAEPDAKQTAIRYDDLDIQQAAGAQVLYHRIQAAAQQVCALRMGDLALKAQERACIEQAIDAAVKNVNSVTLTRLRFGTDLRLAGK
ncbi:MAG: UrcA family protein [Steroidobacteraceae bacterium]|jgi:UrcA family protein